MTAKPGLKDDSKTILCYTNRRRIEKTEECLTTSEERKKENEKEFENICLHLKELSVTDLPSTKGSRTRKPNSNSNISSISSTSSKCAEVEVFQKFLDEGGGHYGGWKEKDHLFFINTRKKYPLQKTAAIVNKNFPDITIEKVFSHDTWYNEYLKMKAAKKRAIEEWRKIQNSTAKVEEEETSEPKSEAESKPQLKRDPKLKEKIEIWKARCFAAQLEKEHYRKEEELKKKKEEDERKRMQEERRASVNRYREEKLSLELALKTAKEAEELEAKKESATKAAVLLKYFRYEDRRFTERQKAKKQATPKQELRVRSAVEAKRDPNRLLQPTLGWIYHVKGTREEHQAGTARMDVTHMPKLKKPAWRKGISSP